VESRTKATLGKEIESYNKVGSRGRGGRKYLKKINEVK